MKRLLILLLLIVTTISGCVQTRSKPQKLSKMESAEVDKLKEIAESLDVTLVDKHPEFVHETFKNMFKSPEQKKLEEIAKSMDITLVDKHPELVYGTFKNMFESPDKLKLQNDII